MHACLFQESDLKLVCSVLRSVPRSAFSLFFYDFPNCSSRESTPIYTSFSDISLFVTQSKALLSRARDYLSKLRRSPALKCHLPLSALL